LSEERTDNTLAKGNALTQREGGKGGVSIYRESGEEVRENFRETKLKKVDVAS